MFSRVKQWNNGKFKKYNWRKTYEKWKKNFNPIQNGGWGEKDPPPAPLLPFFFPVTSNNVRTSPQNFLTFSCKPFGTLVWNFKFAPSASAELLNLNQDHPSKKAVFWSNPFKIGVVITFLIEMLELTNFGHMNTSTI